MSKLQKFEYTVEITVDMDELYRAEPDVGATQTAIHTFVGRQVQNQLDFMGQKLFPGARVK